MNSNLKLRLINAGTALIYTLMGITSIAAFGVLSAGMTVIVRHLHVCY